MAKRLEPWELPNATRRAQLSWLKKQRHPRTRKHFTPYNKYEDRTFGMKWATAYAMDELVIGIQSNHKHSAKVSTAHPEITRDEVVLVLMVAWFNHSPVSIHLSFIDYVGRYLDHILGGFTGVSSYFRFLIG